jgi:hypothetical protein
MTYCPYPVFEKVPVEHLIDGKAELFQDLYEMFSEYGFGLRKLFTWDQINAICDNSLDFLNSKTQTAVLDVITEGP